MDEKDGGGDVGTPEETITIPLKEYESLQDDQHKLCCLEAWGVDNWNGWDEAMTQYEEEKENE